jgi:hypothetical protein
MAHHAIRLAENTIRKIAADLVKDYTDNLYKEFHDWIDQQEFWPRGDTRPTDYTQPMGGPLTYWDNIEEFMKERYPAAYRGYSYGQEQAAPALDGYGMVFLVYPRQERTIPYETGPEAVSKYGYDPRQVAAGFMYLHSKAHNTARPTSRTNRIPRDIDRLSDIFQKRVEMQDAARQRKLVHANETQKLYRILDLSFPDHPSAGYFGNSHKGFARIPDLMHHDPNNELPDVILDGIRKHVGPHWTKSKMWARDNPWHHPPGATQ